MFDILFENTPLLIAGVFFIGLIVGSFLNVVILRLPRRMEHEWRCQCKELLELEAEDKEPPPSIIWSRSYCPNCKAGIKAHQNIPVLSYLFLRGKCATCQHRISIRYPLVEFFTALLFAYCIWHFGPTLAGLAALFLCGFLIALAGIDIDHQLLPDNLTLSLLWAGLLLNGIYGTFTDPVSSILGAACGYLVLWTIYQLFKLLTGKEGMGYGDFKLMAALGAWMGWQMLPLIILLSSLLGAVIGLIMMGINRQKRGQPMPFGPYIALAGLIAFFWGQKIIDQYLSASGILI